MAKYLVIPIGAAGSKVFVLHSSDKEQLREGARKVRTGQSTTYPRSNRLALNDPGMRIDLARAKDHTVWVEVQGDKLKSGAEVTSAVIESD